MSQQVEVRKEEFKKIVLRHISEEMGTEEWARFRRFAGDDEVKQPEAAIDEYLTVAYLTRGEILKQPTFKAKTIAALNDAPVIYILDRGIYFWTPEEDAPMLMFWCTEPKYPLDW
ncbi:MAG TPA: hypothetical protein VIE65_13055 [Methylobacter sp.]|jgi:hypothetical protein